MKPNVTPEAVNFFNSAANFLAELHSRWLDEKEHEDIKDYVTPLQPIAAKCGVVIVKMNKKPFGCDFSVNGKTFGLFSKVSGGRFSVGYTRKA